MKWLITTFIEWFSNNILGLLSIFLLIWLVFQPTQIISRKNNKLRRGIVVYRESLSNEYVQFLSGLASNLEETLQIFSFHRPGSYIRKEGNQILIVAFEKGYSTSHPYIGYVDLSSVNPQIEYRTSLVGFLILFPFCLALITIPFIAAIEYYNFRKQQSIIKKFIQRCIEAQAENKPLFTNLIGI